MADNSKARPDKEQTEVTKWLRKHQASEFVDAFYDQGYYDLADVDDAAIDALVKQMGTAKRLKRSVKKPASAEPKAPPSLPPDVTPELSSPQLNPSQPVVVQFPSEPSTQPLPAEIVAPTEVKPEEWATIADNSQLLYAWRMNGVEPKRGDKPVLDWVAPKFVRAELLEADVDSSVSYTETTANYVDSGFDMQSASIGYAFCSASFKRARNERRARSSGTRTLYATGVWRYPRASLNLVESTKPSSEFVDAVQNALDSKDPARALQEVFDEYGHAIPRRVLLGGQLWFTQRRTETENVDEEEVTREIKLAVGLKLGAWAPEGGFQHATGTKTTEWMKEVIEGISWKVRGGDPTLLKRPEEWAQSVKDPEGWGVIVNVDAQPTVERLPAELRRQLDEYSRREVIADPVVHESIIAKAKSTGFLIGTRECGWGQRGSIHLVSGRPTRDEIMGAEASAGAGAFAHLYPRGDVHYPLMSASIPVTAGDYCGSFFDDTWGDPQGWLLLVKCDFALGEWQPCALADGRFVPSEDGFLLVSIDANQHGWRGGVTASVNGQLLAGAAVHWYDPTDNHINKQAFCIPVPAQSSVVVEPRSTVGSPHVTPAWMPMKDELWRMEPAQPRGHGAPPEEVATDGILTGWIDAPHGTRGCLAMYAGQGGEDYNDWSKPCAATSAHYYPPHDRWVNWSSAMLPVGRGARFKTSLIEKFGEPNVQLHWTPIVPR